MRYIYLLTFLLFTQISFAQTFEFGSGFQIYNFRGDLYNGYGNSGISIRQMKFNFTALFGANIPVKRVHERVMMGVSPNLSFGAFYDMFSADLPVYLTFKTGVTSTKDDLGMFGAGIGVGGMLSFFSTNLTDNYGLGLRYSNYYVSPAIMAEVSADFNSTVYKLRIDVTPVPKSSYKLNVFNGEINQFNVRVLKTFL